MRSILPRWSTLALTALLGLGAQAAELTVSAAASLTTAFKELGPRFEATHPGHTVQFNFGGSGQLLQQIARGAPVDVFVSADQETMDQAQAQGLVRAEQRRDVVSNTLVVVVPVGTANPPASLRDLTGPSVARVAIGVPASVPVGRYAKAALEAEGLWTAIEPKLVQAQNVRQALDYVARREVDAGFVYATDAALLPKQVKPAFSVHTVKPVRYPAAPVAASAQPALARQFVAFLTTPAAQAMLARRGFGPP